MADTLGDLVDRTLRDWLYPPDDQPTRMTLNGAILAADSSLVYDPSILLPEEELLLGPGTLLEIDQEQILVGTVDEQTNTLTDLVRGVNGTHPVDHADNAIITISPTFGRRSVFDALSRSIVALYPRLYRRRAVSLNLTSNYTQVPEDAETPESFICFDGGRPIFPRIRLIDMPTISTGRALLTIDVPAGTTGTLIYRARFPSATSEADVLVDDLGVLPEYEDAVEARAAAHLVAGRDLEAMTTEFLTRQLSLQANPESMTGARMREALLRYYEYQMMELARNVEAVQFHIGWTRGA